jgi:2-oxoisovalerate dehydrogenase E2 component (dihydrolipoyl transacylase)
MLKEMIGKSTICLSDIGEIGGMTMNPLIFGEMVCHVSVGEVRDVAISKNGKQYKRQYANITMGADHRVLDGASCARFTSTWK